MKKSKKVEDETLMKKGDGKGSKVLVSVIVPIYNVEKTLVEKCVDSLVNQSYKNLEILLVDDGNSAEYAEFVKDFENRDSRIKVIVHEHNSGLYQARITGVEASAAEYVTFVDADDYVSVDWIRLLVEKASASKADIVLGRTICEDENHWRFIFNSNNSICTQADKNGEEIFDYLIKDCGLDFTIHTVWNKLYSKTLWDRAMKDLKRVQQHLIMTEDIMFSSILFYHAQKMSFSNHDGYFYYRNGNSSTISTNGLKKCNKNIDDLECVFSTLKQFMIDYNLYDKYETYYLEWLNRYFRWWSYTVSKVCDSVEENEAVALKERFLTVFGQHEFKQADVSDGYFDQKKTQWNDDLEKIKLAITNPEFEVVSFDLFDTLIVRPVLNPEDVYHVVVNETDLGDYDKDLIKKFRTLAENYARQLNSVKNPNYEDVTLTEIYDSMNSHYGVPKNICDALKEKEIATELEFANIRKTGKELYTLAMEMGKRIFITSDMYLEKASIKKILEQNGYDGYEKILLSSDMRALKATGRLFDLLIEFSGVEPGKIIHMGDNWNADVQLPATKGINTFFIPKTKDILLNYLGDKYTGNAYGEALKNEESVVDHSMYFDSFATRAAVATIANVMFDNPFISFNDQSDYNGDPYQLGVMALGPHMYGICKWLLDLAEANNSHKVHFSSRDGFYIQKIFDYMAESCGSKVLSNYLHISRKSFIPIEIRRRSDVKKILTSCSVYANSPKSIIRRYHKLLHSNNDEIKKAYISAGVDMNSCFKSEDEFLTFLKVMEEHHFSEEKAEKEYNLCKKYLTASDIKEKDIIFDLGYSGKLHKDIVDCSGVNAIGAYISKDGYNALSRIEDNGLNIFAYYNFVPSMQGIINEYIFSDRAPSCIGYKSKNGKVVVDFEKKMKDYIGDYVVNEINRGAFEFARAFSQLFRTHMNLIKFMPMDTSLLYEHFLVAPKMFDRAIFDYCLIEDEFYGGIKQRKLTEIWDWQISDRRLLKEDNTVVQIEYVDRIVEKIVEVQPENPPVVNQEWEVYNSNVSDRNICSKALYWFCVDKNFFKQRVKEHLVGKRDNN